MNKVTWPEYIDVVEPDECVHGVLSNHRGGRCARGHLYHAFLQGVRRPDIYSTAREYDGRHWAMREFARTILTFLGRVTGTLMPEFHLERVFEGWDGHIAVTVEKFCEAWAAALREHGYVRLLDR